MCFSAPASFVAGVSLSVIGVVSLKQARSPAQVPFASIPIIFGAQQITEGFLWLAFRLDGFGPLEGPCTYVFLFAAQVLWPIWVPWSILKFEERKGRHIALKVLTGVGAVVSAYMAYCLMTYPVEVRIQDKHIQYVQYYPLGPEGAHSILYFLATIVPPFFGRQKLMKLLGTIILASFLFTTIFYKNHVVSVWCFFAAIISVVVLVIIRNPVMNDIREPDQERI